MGYIPSMKFASGFEILEYCQAMAERFGFYDHCLFHTTVEETEWDEDSRPLDGAHRPRRRHAGALRDPRQRHPHEPEAGPHRRAWSASPGDSFHTSRWNYNVDLEGKRIGIIGTGATAVQAIPELAKVAGHLVRVPAHAVDDRRPRPAGHDAEESRGVGAGARLGAGAGGPASPRSRPAARR